MDDRPGVAGAVAVGVVEVVVEESVVNGAWGVAERAKVRLGGTAVGATEVRLGGTVVGGTDVVVCGTVVGGVVIGVGEETSPVLNTTSLKCPRSRPLTSCGFIHRAGKVAEVICETKCGLKLAIELVDMASVPPTLPISITAIATAAAIPLPMPTRLALPCAESRGWCARTGSVPSDGHSEWYDSPCSF